MLTDKEKKQVAYYKSYKYKIFLFSFLVFLALETWRIKNDIREVHDYVQGSLIRMGLATYGALPTKTEGALNLRNPAIDLSARLYRDKLFVVACRSLMIGLLLGGIIGIYFSTRWGVKIIDKLLSNEIKGCKL